MTAEDWAPYGQGEPDADGWYPDYKVPERLKPAAVDAPVRQSDYDTSWLALVTHWRLVAAGLAQTFHVDLFDDAVLARPWPGVRGMIFTLVEEDPRLRAALRR